MNLSYIEGDKTIENNKNLFALNTFSIDHLNLILNDNEELDLEKNDFIEYLNKILTPGLNYWFVVFDQKDITLKIALIKFTKDISQIRIVIINLI